MMLDDDESVAAQANQFVFFLASLLLLVSTVVIEGINTDEAIPAPEAKTFLRSIDIDANDGLLVMS